jgi:hypothetical protein
MKYQGMLVCLSLLIAPALNTTPRTCMVISITRRSFSFSVGQQPSAGH